MNYRTWMTGSTNITRVTRGGGPQGETPGSGPIVNLDGDLDIVTSEGVKQQLAALLDGEGRTVTIDMGSVDFVDSSGLSTLVAIHQLAQARGGQLVVRSVPSQMQRLLTLTRLDQLLSVV